MAQLPNYYGAFGSTGSTLVQTTGDIGTPDNRLICVFVDEEANNLGTNFAGTVTVGGVTLNQIQVADNPAGAGNHLELHTIHESALTGLSGTQVFDFSNDLGVTGNQWAIHVLVFTGVASDTPFDLKLNQTQVGGNSITVTDVSNPANGLVVMGAAHGASGTWTSFTSPLIERTDGPNPSSAIFATASGVQATAQTTNYTGTASDANTLRSCAIVATYSGVDDVSGVTGNVSENLDVVDFVSSKVISSSSINESLDISDNKVAKVSATSSLFEGVISTESGSGKGFSYSIISETTIAEDLSEISDGNVATIVETVILTDLATGKSFYTSVVTENANVSDSVSGRVTTTSDIVESITGGDLSFSPEVITQGTITDSISATFSVSGNLKAESLITETYSTSDSLEGKTTVSSNIFEVILSEDFFSQSNFTPEALTEMLGELSIIKPFLGNMEILEP